MRLLTVLIAPAIGEEAFFRGLLIPARAETRTPARDLAVATGIFTLWHVFEAKTFLPAAARMFTRPDFLGCAAILGLGCGVIRQRTGSIWPGVALHWLMVTLWQTWLGGFVLEASGA
jgi:predicted Abi (CAAX) family protease